MTARFLAMYTAVILLLPVALLSLVTVVPGQQLAMVAVQCGFGAGALLFGALGYYLRQAPADHWANRMPAVRWALFLAALAASFVVVRGIIV